MSGGSQHNPNGRQPQMGPGWSPLQLQVASYLARAPQAHMPPDRGVTWHTPTPHLYHVPAPSPPDPLQAMKVTGAAANSVFRHTATPPELYRHTPTPPDKHLLRHTPSPGDVKSAPVIPPPDLFPHLGAVRDKLLRPEDMIGYARSSGGVDLSVSRSSNGAPLGLSVRDAPTINSLVTRAPPRPHPRVDALLERLAPSPHSVIVHPRAGPTPSPPSSNEDSADSTGAPPGSKRKRKPEKTIRVPIPPATIPTDLPQSDLAPANLETRLSPLKEAEDKAAPVENGDGHETVNGPKSPENNPEKPVESPHTRRKTRSESSETIDDIAAMIATADKDKPEQSEPIQTTSQAVPVETIENLKAVLTSPEHEKVIKSPPRSLEQLPEPSKAAAAAPKRRSARLSNSECTNVPMESPSEAKPAEVDTQTASTTATDAANTAIEQNSETKPAEPPSLMEVESQLQEMFAGIEEQEPAPKKTRKGKSEASGDDKKKPTNRKKNTGDKSRRSSRGSTGDDTPKKKPGRKKAVNQKQIRDIKDKELLKDAYDSGSNASSNRSRGPYIQIRGPTSSPVSVCVVNASAEEDDRRRPDATYRHGARAPGLHCSTLGLRYDATRADQTWVCAFCGRGPHARTDAHRLGDLFGPYTLTHDCDHYRTLPPQLREKWPSTEAWMHEECAVWASGVICSGAKVWGLSSAVWSSRGAECTQCNQYGATISCATRACQQKVHYPCSHRWKLITDEYRAFCPAHRPVLTE